MSSPIWSPLRTPWRKVCGSNEHRLITEWKEALGSWTVKNSMASIPQVPCDGLCNALPMLLVTQVICPLLCITVRDRLFAPTSQLQDLKLPLTLGVLSVGGLFPHICSVPIWKANWAKSQATLHTPVMTSVSFDTFISYNSKRMGIQIGAFICSGFVSPLFSDL